MKASFISPWHLLPAIDLRTGRRCRSGLSDRANYVAAIDDVPRSAGGCGMRMRYLRPATRVGQPLGAEMVVALGGERGDV